MLATLSTVWVNYYFFRRSDRGVTDVYNEDNPDEEQNPNKSRKLSYFQKRFVQGVDDRNPHLQKEKHINHNSHDQTEVDFNYLVRRIKIVTTIHIIRQNYVLNLTHTVRYNHILQGFPH